ncbi:MAG TPA: HDOD domain-containing protein [Vicinamibacterales bacterium]|nr:HDOD domain-containing protein [Vicinamibacterales bacterium]
MSAHKTAQPGAAAAPSAADQDTFVTRLPILDRQRQVVGYELLFRPLEVGARGFVAPDQTSARVISDAIVSIGLDALTSGRRAFVGISRRLLVEGIPSVLPPDQVVLELGTDVEADAEVIQACREFRRSGYEIAVDDFMLNEWTRDLIPLANYLKVDFTTVTDSGDRQAIVAARGQRGPSLIAKHVETFETFDLAVKEGFTYFQGFFFGRPVIQEARSVPTQQLGNLRLMRALHDPNISVHQLEDLIKHDAGLCYRILRTVNSAAFAQRSTIESIRQALILLGRDTVSRWAAVWVFAGLGGGTQSELVRMATVRARCCELLGQATGRDEAASEGFLVGMCSLLDVLLECSIEKVLEQLPLAPEMRGALLGEDNACRRRLECVIAYESGDWMRALELAERAQIDPLKLRSAHAEALRWVETLTHEK